MVIGKLTFSIAWHDTPLQMDNFGKLKEGSNEGVDWMFPQFQAIKETSVVLTINKMLQVCVGMVDVFKIIDTVGTSICRFFVDNMVMNPTLGFWYPLTRGGWNFRGENFILLYPNFSGIVCVQE